MARKVSGLSKIGPLFREKNTILPGIWRFHRESEDSGNFMESMIYFRCITENSRDIYHNIYFGTEEVREIKN